MSETAASLAETEKEDQKLQDIFLQGWTGFEELEETTLAFNSAEFQQKVKAAMEHFETVTRAVSQIGMFSSNELIDEVSTESMQYLLLPYFLGKLALKLHQSDRGEVLNVAEVYFKDFLERCEEYEISDAPPKKDNSDTVAENGNSSSSGGGELADLMRAAHARNDKISQFRRKKELEEYITKMKEAVKNNSVDEEIKREFFLKFIRKSSIDAHEDLSSLALEKQIVEMRKMHMSGGSNAAGTSNAIETSSGAATNSSHHIHGHGHSHGHPHASSSRPKPKPLQPFIITRNAQQKAVFGMGYPSLPVMTVDEFYHQRVQDGIFPDEEKVARMNQAQAIAAAQNENEKEDADQAIEELQIENDEEEYLERTRRMDEYKDEVRRGDGNRHNRS